MKVFAIDVYLGCGNRRKQEYTGKRRRREGGKKREGRRKRLEEWLELEILGMN